MMFAVSVVLKDDTKYDLVVGGTDFTAIAYDLNNSGTFYLGSVEIEVAQVKFFTAVACGP